ncbi:hypothetical protein [Paraburkholderia rhizosphaerae]|uniref:hypothetical protein n=1 Tax=Paraburkholderia rhizosphaerae TaxID=480658 RepID=UPI00106535BF|nr:hypothetical protein [Paraburkholderia rhizosphaerae]
MFGFKHAVLLGLLFGAVMPAFSADVSKDYDPAETRCQFWDDSSLEKMTAQLDYADQVLPNIPPEEDRYLTAESSAAKKVYEDELKKNDWKEPVQGQGNMRYAALEARPLYTVWGVRKDLVEARQAIDGILKPGSGLVIYRKNPDAEKLQRALRALYPADRYALHMQELLTKQTLTSNNRMITSEQYSRLYGGALTLTTNLGYYMDCKLAKIMGRQSFN